MSFWERDVSGITDWNTGVEWASPRANFGSRGPTGFTGYTGPLSLAVAPTGPTGPTGYTGPSAVSHEPITGLTGEASRGDGAGGYIATLMWDAHPNPELVGEHELHRSDELEGTYSLIVDGMDPTATSTQDLVGDLTPMTEFYYKIKTVFLDTSEVFSEPFVLDTGCHAEAVILLQVQAPGPSSTNATLEWEDVTAPLLEKEVVWGTSMGGPYPFSSGSLATDSLNYEITDLTPETDYYAVVYSRDVVGCAAPSSELHFVTE